MRDHWRCLIDELEEAGGLSAFAAAFARCLDDLSSGKTRGEALLLAALTAQQSLEAKQVCVKLGARRKLSDFVELADGIPDRELPLDDETLPAEAPFVGRGDEASPMPLVLSRGRLYLGRYYQFEKTVAARLIDLRQRRRLADGATVAGVIADGFALDDSQQAAIETALKQGFTAITGGPGTGKTTILCAILVALKRARPDLRILACAPTGKAQARMQEAVDEEFARHVSAAAQAATAGADGKLPVVYGTVHRLLGMLPNGKFRHHAGNRLAADLVIMDEASMADLPIFAKLLDALPDEAGLILLGDKDQLSSVEAGAVLGDLCAAWKDSATVVRLTRSHRFDPASRIAKVKDAILSGDGEAVVRLLADSDADGHDVAWSRNGALLPQIDRALARLDAAAYLTAESPRAALARFDTFRILCAERSGPRGVTAMNAHVRELFGVRKYGKGYPILIQENAPDLKLFNGDILMCWPEADGRTIKAWLDGAGELRSYPISQLPAHEEAFALTIHKSQGSGFKHVLMVLPEREDSPLLTREMVYTGLTRAKATCRIWASERALRQAVAMVTQRDSGLGERLTFGGCKDR